jgi:tetratricopeptide (TPR) repeat protein
MSAPVNRPLPAGFPAVQLARVGRQLLLVPEAVVLLALLCLHAALGAPPLLALAGLLTTGYFLARAALLTLGRRALAAADYRRAARLTAAAIRLYPGSADAQALAGTIHLARGEAVLGVAAFRRAVACYPMQAELHTALSAALLDAGQAAEAREAARQARAADPRCAAAYLHLANAEEQLGASAGAVEALLRAGLALPAAPADAATLRCALAGHLLGQGRIGEARLALSGVEPLLAGCPAPQRAGLHCHLGELLQLAGDIEAARGHFRASEALDPEGRHAAAAWRGARS